MKYCLYVLLAAPVGLAQSNTATYLTDINGRRIETSAASASDGERTELSQSINGRRVPLEQTETRVLSKTASQTVTETTVRKFDRAGALISTERIVEDRQTHPGGSTLRATIYRTDVNGRMQEDEQRVVETQVQGPTSTSDVVIMRPGLTGSFQPFEKRRVVTTTEGDTTQEATSIYRPSQAGQFFEAQRTLTDKKKAGNTVRENTAAYELDLTGKMQLANQTVSTTTTGSDGSTSTELNVYERNSLGRPRDEQGGQKIDEQRLIERVKAPDGSVRETTSIRRATLADPNHLGDPRKISETICTGKCDAPARP